MFAIWERRYECEVNAPIEEVWEFFSDVSSLPLLTPPSISIEFEDDPPKIKTGALIRMLVTRMGVSIRWHARISEVEAPYRFVDIADRSPFPFWEHRHEFVPLEDDRTLIVDTIRFRPIGGVLAPLTGPIIGKDLDRMFAYRSATVQERLSRQPSFDSTLASS
ncbi:MAG: SRPBCC family protein [Armatimonadetes bacterium]|nr:SRPBCC family protein [Armatimonadota bacterium]